jgi:ribosomal protein S3
MPPLIRQELERIPIESLRIERSKRGTKIIIAGRPAAIIPPSGKNLRNTKNNEKGLSARIKRIARARNQYEYG